MASSRIINITVKDIIWNYTGSILNIGMNVFLLPILLNVLNPIDLGLWYVFSSISGLIILLDFGFSPTIGRSVTLAWCGASEISKNGIMNVDNKNTGTNFSLLKSLFKVSKKIYFWISLISLLILLTAGTGYVYSLIHKYNNLNYYLLSWVVYAFSISINMYFSYWNIFLRSTGALKQLNIATIISRVLFVALSIIGLLINGGLLAIAIAQIISGLALRLLCKKEFMEIAGIDFISNKMNNKHDDKEVLNRLLPNSTKYGIVSIGGFLSQRADILLCSSFFGLTVTSSYGLTMQLFNLLGSITQLLFASLSPQITQEKLKGNKAKEVSLLSVSLVFQFLLGGVGILVIVFIVPWILGMIGSNSVLLPQNQLLVLGVILLFEWNTSVFINFLMTSNVIPFVKTSIFSGIILILCSLFFIVYTKIGIYSLIIGRAFVGFGFNNWYWPKYVCKKLDTKMWKLLNIGTGDIIKKVSDFFILNSRRGEDDK